MFRATRLHDVLAAALDAGGVYGGSSLPESSRSPSGRKRKGEPTLVPLPESAIVGLARWMRDPVAFVREVFGAEPDAWQADVLRSLLTNPRIAMSACKGPGKSTVMAWCGWWILVCHKDAQGIAVSITADNLRDGLWKELALWYSKSELLQAAFTVNAERIASKERPKTWWLSARSFPQQADSTQQSNTLAGLHAADSATFVLLDEVGDYPLGVLTAAEGIFANLGRAWIIAAGNPTRVDGALHLMCTRDAARWKVVHVTGDPDDPMRSPRISKEWAQAEIDKWGRDNPWVKVNILGQFPDASSDQLIGVDLVITAMGRVVPYLGVRTDARVWGLDPARYGDDESALCRRQGVVVDPFSTWRNLDGTQLGDRVGALLLEANERNTMADQLFVDVGGVGASAFDRLRVLGWDDVVQPVDYASAPSDSRFLNKRAEMWWTAAQALKTLPVVLPKDPVLQGELTAPRFNFKPYQKRTVFGIESKEDMKKRGVPSPNRADAFCQTYAAPVMPKARSWRESEGSARQTHCDTDYDLYGGT